MMMVKETAAAQNTARLTVYGVRNENPGRRFAYWQGIQRFLVFALLALPASSEPQKPYRLEIRPEAPNAHTHGALRDVRYPTAEQRAANIGQLLGLSKEQQDRVQAIFVDEDKRSTALWQDSSLSAKARTIKLDQLRDQTVHKVRDLLTADQKKKYDAIAPAKPPAERPHLEPDDSGPY
jgi:hypothetical protein